jgi:hypothetical protein
MTATRTGRKVKVQNQIQSLYDNGFRADFSGFLQYFADQGIADMNLANGHIAHYIYSFPENITLVQRLTGKSLSWIEFLCEFLKREGEFAYAGAPIVTNYEPTIELCVELARENNALLSIAHPNFTFVKGRENLKSIIKTYVDAGVRGIEINATASKEWVKTILEVREKYNLILISGSDCHFDNSTDGKHGEFGSRNPYLSDVQFQGIVEKFIETVS